MSNILEVSDLHVDVLTERGIGHVVRGLDLSLAKGEIHGIVGESGCGKTVTAKSILQLHDGKKTEYRGSIRYRDTDLLTLKEKKIRHIRGKEIAYIFQHPMTSFDNLFTIGEQISETIRQHLPIAKKEAWQKTLELLVAVGVTPAEKRARQHPYEFSGGMLQRAMIAMAISADPQILIADEATTALDVTMQARVLALLKKLRDENHLSILCITHNFGVVAEICDTVTVMYAGTVVETGSVREIFYQSIHPYTRGLIENITCGYEVDGSIPKALGKPYDITEETTGCVYAARCPHATERCFLEPPSMKQYGIQHKYRCHYEAENLTGKE